MRSSKLFNLPPLPYATCYKSGNPPLSVAPLPPLPLLKAQTMNCFALHRNLEILQQLLMLLH